MAVARITLPMQSHAKHAKWMEHSVRSWAEVATRDLNSANKPIFDSACSGLTHTRSKEEAMCSQAVPPNFF